MSGLSLRKRNASSFSMGVTIFLIIMAIYTPRASSDDHYDVTNYGAVGDNTADDTTEIQDAIDDAKTAGGGVVFLPVRRQTIPDTVSKELRCRLARLYEFS